MFKLYHGTTLSAHNNIMFHGFHEKKSALWSCSVPGVVYLYNPFGVRECNGDEDEPVEDYWNMSMKYANENAQIQNAIKEIPDNYTVVMELVCEDDSLMEEFETDSSCPGMDAAVEISAKRLNELIFSGKIQVIPHYFPFCVKMSLAYLAGVYKTDYCQEAIQKLTPFEKEWLKALSDVYIPYEDFIWVEEVNKDEIIF